MQKKVIFVMVAVELKFKVVWFDLAFFEGRVDSL